MAMREVPDEPNALWLAQGCLLTAIVSFFTLPLIFFVGAKDKRASRFTGFAIGILINFLIFAILAALNPQ